MYMSAASAAAELGYPGFASWCLAESKDEFAHGNRVSALLQNVYRINCVVKTNISAFAKPVTFESLLRDLLQGEVDVANSLTKMLAEIDACALPLIADLAAIQRDSITFLNDLIDRVVSATGDKTVLDDISKNLEISYVTGCPES
jgi:ferritin